MTVLNDTVAPSHHAALMAQADRLAQRVHMRYRDAYRVARAIVQVGFLIKIVSALVGLLGIIALAINAGPSRPHHSPSNGMFGVPIPESDGGPLNPATITTAVGGFSFAFSIYFVGLLVSALGQILKASLDNAVHSSPFLNDDQRATVMSLS